jgi:hypothetical protein
VRRLQPHCCCTAPGPSCGGSSSRPWCRAALRRRGKTRAARSRATPAPPQVPLARCLVLGSTAHLVQAAAAAGAVGVAIPRKLSERATFPAARAKMDGYGAGAATWRRLAALLPEQQ